MTLAEVRKDWEKLVNVVAEVPVVIDGYPKLFVILESHSGKNLFYRLHRYFPVGSKWQVSVDMEGESQLSNVIKHIQKDKDFSDVMKLVANYEGA